MPKGFTGRERDLIRKKLFSEGTRLFEQYGIQKTTVDEIARSAGISKGSFYAFYGSKEELYFDIMENIEREIKARLFSEVFTDGQPHRESFRKFIHELFGLMDGTPLFRGLDPASIGHLIRKLPEEKLAGHMGKDYAAFEDFYRDWKDRGIFKDIDVKAFVGILKLMFYLILHKSDSTPEEFNSTRELYIDMLCEYLISE